MSDHVTISFDADDVDSDGAPMAVWVQVGNRERRMYEPKATTRLLNYRTCDAPVEIAMCDECGSETYTDDDCLYCCMCGARIERGDAE